MYKSSCSCTLHGAKSPTCSAIRLPCNIHPKPTRINHRTPAFTFHTASIYFLPGTHNCTASQEEETKFVILDDHESSPAIHDHIRCSEVKTLWLTRKMLRPDLCKQLSWYLGKWCESSIEHTAAEEHNSEEREKSQRPFREGSDTSCLRNEN